MASEWQSLTVDQIKAGNDRSIAIGPFGSRMKADTYVSLGVPVIRGNNISDTKAFTGEFVHVSEETADELRACNVFPGDLVFPHRGAIGQVGIVTESEHPRFMLSTSLMKLTCRSELVEPLFVFYFFRSAAGRNALLEHASTVGTPGIGQPLASLRSIRVPVPSLSEQRAIAHILGTLDDKIELNRKQNETLEEIARALFKAWFVDFEPVRAKMEGRWQRGQSLPGLPENLYDLFPDRMIQSESGEIPDGWLAFALSDVAQQEKGAVNPFDSPQDIFAHYSLPAFDAAQMPVIEMGVEIKSNKTPVPDGAVLVSKLNPHIPRIWQVGYAGVNAVCSTEFIVWVPTVPANSAFLYCLASSAEFNSAMRQLVTGTSNSHQRVKPGQLGDIRVFSASRPAIVECSRLLTALIEPVLQNRQESRTLAQLRDTLLPKLVSGELRVPDAERIVRGMS